MSAGIACVVFNKAGKNKDGAAGDEFALRLTSRSSQRGSLIGRRLISVVTVTSFHLPCSLPFVLCVGADGAVFRGCAVMQSAFFFSISFPEHKTYEPEHKTYALPAVAFQ